MFIKNKIFPQIINEHDSFVSHSEQIEKMFKIDCPDWIDCEERTDRQHVLRLLNNSFLIESERSLEVQVKNKSNAIVIDDYALVTQELTMKCIINKKNSHERDAQPLQSLNTFTQSSH